MPLFSHKNFLSKIYIQSILEACFQQMKTETIYLCEESYKKEIFQGITLHARPDHINVTEKKIIDYKTGTPPTKSDVTEGHAPQLLLESLLLENISEVEIWALKGHEPYLEKTTFSYSALEQQRHKHALMEFLLTFLKKDTPFLICPHPKLLPAYRPYAHLERSENF